MEPWRDAWPSGEVLLVDSTYSQSKVIDRQVIEIRTIVFPCINVLGVSKVVDRTCVNVPRIA